MQRVREFSFFAKYLFEHVSLLADAILTFARIARQFHITKDTLVNLGKST